MQTVLSAVPATAVILNATAANVRLVDTVMEISVANIVSILTARNVMPYAVAGIFSESQFE